MTTQGSRTSWFQSPCPLTQPLSSDPHPGRPGEMAWSSERLPKSVSHPPTVQTKGPVYLQGGWTRPIMCFQWPGKLS